MNPEHERQALADIIARYMRGEIDNFEFDEQLFCFRATDPAVKKIASWMWYTYDDIRRHHFEPYRSRWQAYRRILAFLQTSLPLPSDPKRAISERCWPFQDVPSILAARPSIEHLNLPPRSATLPDPEPKLPRTLYQLCTGGLLLLGTFGLIYALVRLISASS